MQFKKVMKRWLINGMGIIVVLLLFLEIAIGIAIRAYYYQEVQNSLYTRVRSLTDMLEMYVDQPDFQFEESVHTFVEDFPEKEKMELQFLNNSGDILASSTGFLPESEPILDYQEALKNKMEKNEAKGVWVGKNAVGQTVTAVSVLVFDENGNLYGGVRCLSAMDKVNQQVGLLISAVVLFGLAVVFFVVFSSSYFIRSILRPLMEIGDTAKRIAQGDYHSRIEKQFDDEIGELCDTINDMAAEIAKADQLQNEFIASISHELRTPLTAIKGWSETLCEEEAYDPELLKKGLTVIADETERLSDMVEELLDFSHMRSADKQTRFEYLDIFAEVEETVFLFREQANRENIDIQCVLQEELPVVKGDRFRLRQVFSNILDNAIKYTQDHGMIRVEAALLNGRVQLVFSDNGMGIPPEVLPHVKNKFYRGNNLKPGSGIGLAVADEIIRSHGGTLEIESKLGKGTIVTINLPIMEKRGIKNERE